MVAHDIGGATALAAMLLHGASTGGSRWRMWSRWRGSAFFRLVGQHPEVFGALPPVRAPGAGTGVRRFLATGDQAPEQGRRAHPDAHQVFEVCTGLPAGLERLQVDRQLEEALTTGADPLHLAASSA